MRKKMKIAIGNDHAATELKFVIMDYLKELGHEVINFGADTLDSCNYPEYGEKVGRAVVAGEADCGVLICGTGVGINLHLEYYDDDILSNIIRRSASILDVPCSVRAASEIASRSRGTPRIANALLRRVRDFAQVKGSGSIDTEIAQFALEALNIDKYGLDEIDNKILCTIIDKFKGGPVGLTTIATALGEDAGTIEEVYEPFLIKEGFMKRTPRGREVTELAYKHLGRSLYSSQKTLFND